MKFYNRKDELKALRRVYDAAYSKLQTVVIYGRRRVGKTELVKQFTRKNREKSFYLFVEVKDEQMILSDLENVFYANLGYRPRFGIWDNFFNFLKKKETDSPLVIVFDEFPNFLKINKGLLTKFQKYIDELQDKKIMFVLLGSYVGLMKKIFMNRKEPLYGRADRIINLKPFNFFEAAEMIKDAGFTGRDMQILLYGMLDGIPKYLLHLFEVESGKIDQVIKYLFLSPTAPLYEEGRNILIREFGGEHKGYFSILEAISCGNTKPGEIANYISQKGFRKYIKELNDEYEVIRRIIPVTKGQNTTKSRYEICDNFYYFWFRYIYKNHTGIEYMPEKVLERIKNDLHVYAGQIYEKVCTQYLLKKLAKEDFVVTRYGRWWDKNNEIDIVILDKPGQKTVFGDCKYRSRKTGVKNLKTFIARTKMVPWYNSSRKEKLYFFSKGGFTDKAEKFCKATQIKAITRI